jgi:nitrogenase molybdenum-cofactor synthesis protein NifE
MKGLRKYLTPFAPDQSGAVSVLYELGGIVVICDAGGCTGNICGFDEPRWHTHRSAIFSAGLRDMDAILGRDDKLVAELVDAAGKIDARFAAIVGTPVPSVIGTDYLALRRMTEKKVELPVLTVDTTGMELYDIGAEKAYLALMRRFAKEKQETVPGRIGVFGVNPLDLSDLRAGDQIRSIIPGAMCFGMGSGLDEILVAPSAERNIVAALSGLRAAQYLKEKFGIPYEVYDPTAERLLPEFDYSGKRILVIDQQVRANTMRELLVKRGAAEIHCATWFLMDTTRTQPGDCRLKEEDDFEALVYGGDYDLLIGDPTLWRIIPNYSGETIDIPQFPVSGRLGGDALD